MVRCGQLRSRLDLVVDLNQMLDDPTLGGKDRDRTLDNKEGDLLARASHRLQADGDRLCVNARFDHTALRRGPRYTDW